MQTKKLHNWDLSYSQARKLQTILADAVQLHKLTKPPKLVAGLDCAICKDDKKIFAAVVVLTLPDLKIVETTSSACEFSSNWLSSKQNNSKSQ